MADLELTGVKALEQALQTFPVKFVNKGIRRVFRETMKATVLPDAKRNIAIGQTGMLKRDVKVRAAKGKKGKRLPRGILGIAVGTSKKTKHDVFVLLNRKLRDGRVRPGDKTLRKALFGNKAAVRSRVETGMRRELPRIARESRGV